MVFPRAICNNIAPRPRIFFVLGLRPRTKKILGLGAILLHIALGKTIYTLHISHLPTLYIEVFFIYEIPL